jgi:uncharacterized protein DUF1515
LMIGGLLEASQNTQRELSSLRHDLKESEARQALSYEQSETRSAASRAAMHTKQDVLGSRMSATENEVKALKDDMADVKAVTDDVTRWRLMGMGALGITGIAFASLGSLVTVYWHDIVRVFRGG